MAEFVVVLNNQPQGGLAMRQRPSDVVARRNPRNEDGFGPDRAFGWNSPYGYAPWRSGVYDYQRQLGGWW
jgi:hypothetical protein